ncbi:deoxyuridine 5'-triphosphate nucleotidohydrolase [Ferrithrix thermotolerans DSM 19514]|uniref:Deoxyuridine 5'-triphosphate nucleotidohydrolase n=1 Tax=Ferrithrix thermotolerans DSM 19514 TaxID=1121881 RepID=A0A1M4S4Y1_9ACTN|nr:dUTP diphosphatase [Ferrithrix thermotolerans]SHE27266.1 deoxyuridine 5'-triphosphate nucleotidohydrolase [Ferrithrix thermotolerans DSM 19514]
MKVEIQLAEGVPLPTRAIDGDAGFDLRSNVSVELAPCSRTLISTGIRLSMPQGLCALVLPRSGLALKHGITLMNSPGLIDSGYRGEIKVILYNSDTQNHFLISEGDRVAQILFLSYPDIEFVTSEYLTSSERGTGGFGHSGL